MDVDVNTDIYIQDGKPWQTDITYLKYVAPLDELYINDLLWDSLTVLVKCYKGGLRCLQWHQLGQGLWSLALWRGRVCRCWVQVAALKLPGTMSAWVGFSPEHLSWNHLSHSIHRVELTHTPLLQTSWGYLPICIFSWTFFLITTIIIYDHFSASFLDCGI